MLGDGELEQAEMARLVERRWRAASAEFRAARELRNDSGLREGAVVAADEKPVATAEDCLRRLSLLMLSCAGSRPSCRAKRRTRRDAAQSAYRFRRLCGRSSLVADAAGARSHSSGGSQPGAWVPQAQADPRSSRRAPLAECLSGATQKYDTEPRFPPVVPKMMLSSPLAQLVAVGDETRSLFV